MVDSLKNHLVPHISKLKTTKAMFDSLKNLFENNYPSKALALRHQLHYIKVTNDETVDSYFMKVSQLRDDLSVIKETTGERELVMMTLNGFPDVWEPSSRALVGEISCPRLIDYGQIVNKRRLDFCPEEVCTDPIMQKIMHLQLIQEEVETEDQLRLKSRKRRIFHKSNATIAIHSTIM